MDALDRLLGHDAWTTRQLLLRCDGLTEGQLDHEFDIAHRTVRAKFLHVIRNVEVWSDLMAGQPVRPDARDWPEGRTVVAPLERLDRAAADLARVARAVADRGGWDERWVDTLDDPPAEKPYGAGNVRPTCSLRRVSAAAAATFRSRKRRREGEPTALTVLPVVARTPASPALPT